MFNKKTKLKLTDFECNLLINGMNEFRNMLQYALEQYANADLYRRSTLSCAKISLRHCQNITKQN